MLAVIEGKRLLDRESVEKLRDLITDLQLIDGTRGLISIFSARQPSRKGEIPAPLFPDPLPEGAAYQALIHRVMENEILRGKLLSEDGQLTLVVLALDPSVVESKGLSDTVGEIRKTMGEDLAGLGLNAQLSGVPVMQLEIRNAVERDRLLYNLVRFTAGCLIAILFFRRVSFMVIAAGPPLIAIVLALGALGWLDFRLNMFLNVMTPLIMVISFSDSMQLTFATRDRLLTGQDKYEALKNAILIVGPACVLTHVTAALSFMALQFSTSDLIRTFGQAGLIATLIALLAVLILVPLLGVLLLRNETVFATGVRRRDLGVVPAIHLRLRIPPPLSSRRRSISCDRLSISPVQKTGSGCCSQRWAVCRPLSAVRGRPAAAPSRSSGDGRRWTESALLRFSDGLGDIHRHAGIRALVDSRRPRAGPVDHEFDGLAGPPRRSRPAASCTARPRLETRHDDQFNGGRLSLESPERRRHLRGGARGFVLERD